MDSLADVIEEWEDRSLQRSLIIEREIFNINTYLRVHEYNLAQDALKELAKRFLDDVNWITRTLGKNENVNIQHSRLNKLRSLLEFNLNAYKGINQTLASYLSDYHLKASLTKKVSTYLFKYETIQLKVLRRKLQDFSEDVRIGHEAIIKYAFDSDDLLVSSLVEDVLLRGLENIKMSLNEDQKCILLSNTSNKQSIINNITKGEPYISELYSATHLFIEVFEGLIINLKEQALAGNENLIAVQYTNKRTNHQVMLMTNYMLSQIRKIQLIDYQLEQLKELRHE